ncbi:Cyanobacterial phytochrome B [Penicillium rolfsii]|nr:Cyanobacterial phytochrome B [Penicillium rolfsii]
MDSGYQASLHRASTTSESHGYLTTRFNHVVTEFGHAVVTGTDAAAFHYCEDEPIRIPGAIQSFGVMLALREEAANQLVVRVVSENSNELMGYSAKQLFELESFCDILWVDQAEELLNHVKYARDNASNLNEDGPEVFSLVIATTSGEIRHFWCATHIIHAQNDLIMCELELKDDKINPLNNCGTNFPNAPVSTLDNFPTMEQCAASSIMVSQPLRILRTVRSCKDEAAVMEVFSLLAQIQEQLGSTSDLDTLLNTAVGIIMDLTGFHKVLIYRFDSRWNGLVVAELVDPRATVDLYKGLHFPSSDIPSQARELYRLNKIRLIYDRDQVTSLAVCRTLEDLKTPLDMTHSYLRAISPIHIKYLANMEIRSSMSISLTSSDKLWGLISCHSYGNKGMRVPFPIRKMCRLLGDMISRNIKRLSDESQIKARDLISTLPTGTNPSGYTIATLEDLMELFDSDYVAVSLCDERKILGDETNLHEVLAILAFLSVHQLKSVIASHNITKDFRALRYPPGFKVISGMLYIPLSTEGWDFIVFLRKGQEEEISWGGNPYKETAGYLEPRTSFASWRETILGQSREWSNENLETGAVLCFIYGKFIKVRRHADSAMEDSHIFKEVLANSAHMFHTPLGAIISNLEKSLQGALDAETRENLIKSYPASKSMVYVINDLLDLSNTKKGQNFISSTTEEHSSIHFDTPSSGFGLGIRAWCIDMIYQPTLKLRPDLQGFVLIEWQIFNLRGQSM